MHKRFVSRWKHLFGLLCCLLTLPCFATNYPEKMHFQNLFENRDINIGEVEVTLQDSEGFIWLGGRNAILRYDGAEFIPFNIRTDESDPEKDTLATQAVDLYEDSRGRLWVATRTGVIWFDRDLQVFKPFPKKPDQNHNIDTATINKIIEAPSGEILVASYTGIAIVDPHTFDVEVMAEIEGQQTDLSSNVVHDIIRDGDTGFWLATEQGLNYLAWPSRKVTHYLPNPAQPKLLEDNDIWAIEYDSHGNLWAGTHHGIYYFDTTKKTFKRYKHQSDNSFSLGADLVRDVMRDSLGVMWVGTDGGGLNAYDEDNDRFIRFQHQKGQKGTLLSNSTRAMFEDRNGDLWIGTYPYGINFFDRSSGAISLYNSDPNNPNSLPHNSVLTLQEDAKGNLWLGTDGGGISHFNRFENTFTHYQKETGKTTSNAILSSLLDSKGRLWIGTWGGAVNLYNPEKDTFEQVPFDQSIKGLGSGTYQALNDEAVWSIYEDKSGRIWIGTHSGGLNEYKPDTGEFINHAHDRHDLKTISNQLVWTTFEDSKGRFWVGTANGLDLFDRESGIASHFKADDSDPNSLSNNSVLEIFEDKSGNVWFGTDWGLNRLNDDGKSFTVFGPEQKFLDNGIRSITQDDDGNLWLGTNGGIVMFNPESMTVNNYKRASGQQLGGFNTGSALFSQRQEVIFGGTNGLRIFNTQKLSTNETPPPVVLTDFRIFTKSVPINGPDAILTKGINQSEQVTLDYKKNMFALSFAALNYRDPDKNRYAYKLEGFDEDWREVGNKRTALYTNLDGGTYQFRVKASNNDGVWNDTGKTLTIVQLPPPWKTWWAYTLYVLIFVGAIARFVYGQHKKRQIIEEQKRKLEVMVAERTQELREKNNDIQAMLSNMRQGLFTVEPSGNIHPEYSSYLHTIFATDHIAGRDAIELLFENANLGGDSLNQAQEGIKTIIGEDEMNFTFNSHTLPTEYSLSRGDKTQYLSLDWDPILDDDETVIKLMVSVRDVTALKQAESDAEAQRRELDIISQLIKVPHKKYVAFEASTEKFVTENRAQVSATTHNDPEVVALLFRNMHTIKGNCRTYGFSFFSDIVHDVETRYSDLKGAPDNEWSQSLLLEDLDRVSAIAAEYHKVYYEVLGRGEQTGDALEQPFLDTGTITHIHKCIREAAELFPEAGKSSQMQSANILLNLALSNTMSSVLEDIVDSLPSIAKQLGKEPPRVNIDDSNIRIRSTSHELLNNVFAHILRNSVDHGIEAPAGREAAGKAAQGWIDVFTSLHADKLHIHVKDDGRGVNVEKLFEKGVAMGVWQNGDTPSDEEVANLVFASGASTKDEVSAISGRGVGMDAVKKFLQNVGGDISLNLLGVKEPTSAFIPFETVIVLPAQCFTVIRYETP